jgi:tetratricopeptide (TPR) repeat protein
MLKLSFAVLTLVVSLFATAVFSQEEQNSPPGTLENQPAQANPQIQELKDLAALYNAGEHQAVIEKAEAFLAKYPLTNDNMGVLFYQAASHYKLGQIDGAISAYQKTVPLIEKLNNIQQHRYAFVFFMLGTSYRQQRRYDNAIEQIESGLRRDPQNTYYQILLGELYREAGDRNRAQRHFNEILNSTAPTSEEKIVLRIKLDRLKGLRTGSSVAPFQMSRERFHHGFSFALVPLNYLPPNNLLRDICLLLESKWLVGCEAMAPLSLDEAKIFDRDRKQFAGDRVLQELRVVYPESARSHRLIVALVDRDLFGPKTNFVFSWQNPYDGIGVVSAYRFFST